MKESASHGLRRTALALMVICLATGCAGRRGSERTAAVVESIGARIAADGRITGFSVAVGRRGRIEYSAGFGVADTETGAPATAETVYPIASITKHLTAALVLSLAEDGLLDLDDPIARWIPDLPGGVPGEDIRIHHLLSHTSGLFNIAEAPAEEVPASGPHDRAALMRVLSRHDVSFPPGAMRRYSNSGFLLAGEIASRAAGEPYFSALQSRVLRPAGMSNTHPTATSSQPPNRAASYLELESWHEPHGLWESIPGAPDGYAVPGGFLQSTAEDLVRLAIAIERGQIISRLSVERMRRPTELAIGMHAYYGLGTRLGSVGGVRKVGHTGGLETYRAALAHYPDEDLTIAVLLNTDLRADATDEAATIENEIARALLDVHPGRSTWHASRHAVPARYGGRYLSQDGGAVDIEVRGADLVIRRQGGSELTYIAAGPQCFVLRDVPQTVWSICFTETEDGRIRVTGSDSGWIDEWQLLKTP